MLRSIWQYGKERIGENPKAIALGLLVVAVIAPFFLESPLKTDKRALQAWGMPVIGDVRDAYIACKDQFETLHPDVEVTMFAHGRCENPQKLLSAIVGGAPPDVLQFERYAVGDWVARGAFMPLDEFLAREDHSEFAIKKEDYIPSSWEQCRIEGRQYAIPSWTNCFAMAYNRKLFREAGLPDRAPRTWAEALEFSKKLTEYDEKGQLVRGGWMPSRRLDVFCAYDVLHCVWAAGYDFFPGNGRRVGYDAEPMRETCEFFRKLYDLYGGYESVLRLAPQEMEREFDDFLMGRYAMNVEEDWVLYRTASFAPDFELGVGPIPGPDGPSDISYSGGLCFVIPTDSRDPELAWEFIKYMNSPEAVLVRNEAWLAFIHELYGKDHIVYSGFHSNQRVNETVFADPRFKLPNPQHQQAAEYFYSKLPQTRGIRPSPAGGLFFDVLSRTIRRYLKGDATFDEAFGAAEYTVDKQLDDYYMERTELKLTGPAIFSFSVCVVSILVTVFAGIVAWKSRGRGLRKTDTWAGYLMASPWLFGFLLFTAGPIVASILLSFCDYSILSPARFVGLDNYREALSGQDPLFYRSLGNTAFMAMAVPLNMFVSLLIALLLNLNVRGMRLYRTLYYIPAIVPLVASALLWQWLFHPQNGPITAVYELTIGKWTGIPTPLWLGDAWIKPSFVLMGLWGAGAGMIIWLAGLKGIPESLYESSSIDGAGALSRFRFITLPMLTPYIFFNLVTGIIGTFQMFTRAMVMTRDIPSDSILFYVYHLFNNGFRYFRMGYASAMAWILFILVLALTYVQVRGAKRWVYYGGD